MSENEKKLDVIYGELLNRCWQDEAYLECFRAEPAEVLAEAGIPVKAGAVYHVMEQSQDKFFLILPQSYPDEEMEKLGDLKAELRANGGLRDDTVIEVLQNTDEDVYLPYYPAPKFKALSDDELQAVAGGKQVDDDGSSSPGSWTLTQDSIVTTSLAVTQVIVLSIVLAVG